jgi:4-amino-4-deoxy-L-arabinose transferase-like glycosyltransferase
MGSTSAFETLTPPEASAESRPPEPQGADRRPRWMEAAGVGAILVLFFLNVSTSSLGKVATADEGYHYEYAEHIGRDRIFDTQDRTLMPVSVLSYASIGLRARLFSRPPTDGYRNIPSLFWGRLPNMLWGCLLLLAIYGLCRSVGGPGVGLFGLGLAAACPNLTAHSQWITLDIPGACLHTAFLLGAISFLRRPTFGKGLATSMACAVAQLTKLTNLSLFGLFPLLVVLAVVLRRGDGRQQQLRLLVSSMGLWAGMAVLTWSTLHYVYHEPALSPLRETPASGSSWQKLVRLPAAYQNTLHNASNLNRTGTFAYLRGEYSWHGWRDYWITAIAIKTPLPLLLLFAIAALRLVLGQRRAELWDLALLITIAGYLAYFSFFVKVNIGLRYLLPIYPLLIAFASRAVDSAGRRLKILVVALACWSAAEAVWAYPNQLAYFNGVTGSRQKGYLWLGDSNLDWHQDDGAADRWKIERKLEVAINPNRPIPGLVAVQVWYLTTHYPETPELARWVRWLREECEPSFFITPVWPVFEVPKDIEQRVKRISEQPRRTSWTDGWRRAPECGTP